MHYQSLTFADIMETSILYYDKDEDQTCRWICEHLRIDSLPSLDGQKKYLWNGEKLSGQRIRVKEKVNVSDRIFHAKSIKKFISADHGILFVYDEEKGSEGLLAGIVHVSDYNRDVVLGRIQDDLLEFERILRQYLQLIGKTNKDMLEYFSYKAKKEKDATGHFSQKSRRHEQADMKEVRDSLGAFQIFDLRDLLFFIRSSSNKVPLQLEKETVEQVGRLRNTAMHAKNPIEFKEERLYDTASIEQLTNSLHLLKKEYLKARRAINEHETGLKIRRAKNKATLELIRSHEAAALTHLLTNV